MSANVTSDFCVWWLDQKCVETILAYHKEVLEKCPEYIQSEFNSREGRAGNARLWVALIFSHIPALCEVNWKEEGETENMLYNGCYGGIVLRREDIQYVSTLPGIFTDFDVNIFEPSK